MKAAGKEQVEISSDKMLLNKLGSICHCSECAIKLHRSFFNWLHWTQVNNVVATFVWLVYGHILAVLAGCAPVRFTPWPSGAAKSLVAWLQWARSIWTIIKP